MSANPPRAPGELAEIEAIIQRHVKCQWSGEPFEGVTFVLLGIPEAAAEIASLRSATGDGDGGEANGWQTMESAPKDGTSFLATHEKSGVQQITSFGKTSHVPLYGWTICPDGDPEEIDLWHPTHWMPLPDPPALQPRSTKIEGANE
jgi:hypothetical protein